MIYVPDNYDMFLIHEREQEQIELDREAPHKMSYYLGIGPENGTVVDENQAFEYALERCLKGTLQDQEEFRTELVEWFYSGNWIKREGDVSV